MKLIKEIIEELRSVISGKTFDAILPPTIYVISNNIFGLLTGIILAVLVALLLSFYRFRKNETWQYAFGGFIGVIIASSFAYFAGSAENYFLPDAITSGFILLLVIGSLIMKKPLAAWVSHITRGWQLEWFWRKDVKPAYTEVTIFWGVFFAFRLAVEVYLLIEGNITQLFWSKTLLGLPAIVIVLIITYVFGIWRLHQLGGPGIDEFEKNKKPPWKGQKRGF
ncbi:MAG TPA: DUF3159 domain-containing protein [Clostridia bacterium]|nr:DUF3159 domain-containing protein [Clostridia bacterium]